MARLFDNAQTEYLTRGDLCGISDYPFSFACWFYSDDHTNWQVPMAFGETTVGVDYHYLGLGDSGNAEIRISSMTGGSSATAKSTADYSINTWHHACGVFAAAQDRRVYLDGGNKGTDVVNNRPFGDVTDTAIGAIVYNDPEDQVFLMSGRVAEPGIWNVALTDAEALLLSKGYSPLFVRPQNLVVYWSLVRDDNDRVGRYNMTAYNTPTWAAHSRIIYPATPMIITAPAAVGATMAAYYYRSLMQGTGY